MKLEPGHKLDALVAEKVMGWKWDDHSAWDRFGDSYSRIPMDISRGPLDPWWWLPSYSSDIAAALEIIEKMIKTHFIHLDNHTNYLWRVDFSPHEDPYSPYTGGQVVQKELPLAICLAALKAVGHRHDSERSS